MRRWILPAILALALPLVFAGPAVSAPSPDHNKNIQLFPVTCDNGQDYVAAVNIRVPQDNAAIHILGVGVFKEVFFTAFDPATHQVIDQHGTNFPKAANISCDGSATITDPKTGETFSFDFTVRGVPQEALEPGGKLLEEPLLERLFACPFRRPAELPPFAQRSSDAAWRRARRRLA